MAKTITLKIGDALLEAIDELVRRGLYSTRSEVIRVAVRELVKKELWEREKGVSQTGITPNGIIYRRISMQV